MVNGNIAASISKCRGPSIFIFPITGPARIGRATNQEIAICFLRYNFCGIQSPCITK
jgi:hypothetical protein